MNKFDYFCTCCMIVFLGFVVGFCLGIRDQNSVKVDPAIVKASKQLDLLAKSRGWDIEKKQINSVSIKYTVRVGTGKARVINVLTVRDPFGDLRNVLVTDGVWVRQHR